MGTCPPAPPMTRARDKARAPPPPHHALEVRKHAVAALRLHPRHARLEHPLVRLAAARARGRRRVGTRVGRRPAPARPTRRRRHSLKIRVRVHPRVRLRAVRNDVLGRDRRRRPVRVCGLLLGCARGHASRLPAARRARPPHLADAQTPPHSLRAPPRPSRTSRWRRAPARAPRMRTSRACPARLAQSPPTCAGRRPRRQTARRARCPPRGAQGRGTAPPPRQCSEQQPPCSQARGSNCS